MKWKHYWIVLAIILFACSWTLTIALYHANKDILQQYEKLEKYCSQSKEIDPVTSINSRLQDVNNKLKRVLYTLDSAEMMESYDSSNLHQVINFKIRNANEDHKITSKVLADILDKVADHKHKSNGRNKIKP